MGVILPFISKKNQILQDQMRKQCLSCVEQIKRRAQVLKEYSDPFAYTLPTEEAELLQTVAVKILDAISTLESKED